MQSAQVVAWWLAAYDQGDMDAAGFAAALDDLAQQLPASQREHQPALLDLIAGARSAQDAGAEESHLIDGLAQTFLERVGYDRIEATGALGWYAYTPEGARPRTSEITEDPVREVYIRRDEYAGPFRSDEGVLGDDYEDLQRSLGISRALIDDAFAWNDDVAPPGIPREQWQRENYARQQDLLRRLALEVHPGIKVPAPRSEPPTVVRLGRLNAGPDESRLLLWNDAAVESGEATAMPATPVALNREVLDWVAAGQQYDDGTPENSAAISAWQDQGSALARKMQQSLGDDYLVRAL